MGAKDSGAAPTEMTTLCSQTQLSSGRGNKQHVQGEPQSPNCAPFDDLRDSMASLSTDNNDGSSDVEKPSLWSSSKLQVFLLVALFGGNVLSYMCASMLAPFFPAVALKKGMTSTVTGWVFGIVPLVEMFFAPVVGKLIPVVGSRFLLLSGMFFGGGCTILFGQVDKIPVTQDDNLTFTIFCFILRMSYSLGNAASTIAIFDIGTRTFPHHACTVLGFLETGSGIGLIVGPAVGGALYEVGGFLTPFTVVGSAMVLSVLLYYLILPKDEGQDNKTEQVSMLALLKIPVFDLLLVTVVVSALLWIGLDPILQPHLMQFKLSPFKVGLVDLLTALMYAILAPISGQMADRMENSMPLMSIGFAVLTVAFLLLGPSDLIGLSSYQALWLKCVSIALMGVGVSLTIVPTFDNLIKAAKKAGIPESNATHGMLSSIWASVYAFGEFIGPIYCGAAYDAIGFSWTMTIIAMATFLMSLLLMSVYLYENNMFCCWSVGHKKEQLL